MKRLALPALLVGLWLYAWATNTGVLVWSSVDTVLDREQRVCHYLIGFSVLSETRGEAWRARRCRLIAKVY